MRQIGVPAAMRPISGTVAEWCWSASRDGVEERKRPRLPGITLGENRCALGAATVADSGNLRTSIARARLAGVLR